MKYVAALVDQEGSIQHFTTALDDINAVVETMLDEDLHALHLSEYQSALVFTDNAQDRLRVWADAHDINLETTDTEAVRTLYKNDPMARKIEDWHRRKGARSPSPFAEQMPRPK